MTLNFHVSHPKYGLLTNNFDNFISILDVIMCYKLIGSLFIIVTSILCPALNSLFLFCILSDEIYLRKLEDFMMLEWWQFMHKCLHCTLGWHAFGATGIATWSSCRTMALKIRSYALHKTINIGLKLNINYFLFRLKLSWIRLESFYAHSNKYFKYHKNILKIISYIVL